MHKKIVKKMHCFVLLKVFHPISQILSDSLTVDYRIKLKSIVTSHFKLQSTTDNAHESLHDL